MLRGRLLQKHPIEKTDRCTMHRKGSRPMSRPIRSVSRGNSQVDSKLASSIRDQQREYISVEEGRHDDGNWHFIRIWNGDQTDWGLNFKEVPHVLRVRLGDVLRKHMRIGRVSNCISTHSRAQKLTATCLTERGMPHLDRVVSTFLRRRGESS